LFERLSSLIDKHLKWIDEEQKWEDKRLTLLVGQRFSLDDLYARETHTPKDIDYSRVAERRGNVELAGMVAGIEKENAAKVAAQALEKVVGRGRIELPTPGFSVPCSTN
jgi:hypothetical protein